MQKKVCGLAFMLGLLVAAACGGDQFSVSDFEPGYCAAGNGGAPDSPDDCPAGAGGQAGAGQAGATNKGGAAGNKAGAAGQAGQAGKAGAAGGSSGAGGKCCAGAAGTAGKAGQAGAAGSSAGASGQAGAGQAGIAGSGGIGGSTSGASGAGGAGQAGGGQAGSAGDPGGSSGQGGSGGQPPSCGNGVIEAGETCEGSNFNGATCATLKGPGWTGNLACLGCQTETATCIPPGPSCGNGVIEAGETCEGSNFNGATCATLKGPGWTGSPTCNNCLVSDNSCVAPPPACLGGQMKTPTTMTVEGFNAGTTGLTAYELRYDGGETYDDAVPVEIDLTTSNGPRILVASGFNGIDAKLLNSAVAHPLYNADITNVSECQGALVKTQGCDHKIAKDLWCTLHANEQSNCSITTSFASLSSVKAYVVGNPGNTKVAWDVRCMQLPKHLSFSTSNLPRVATEFHRSIVQERSSVTPTVGQKTKSLSPRRLKISVGVF